MLVLVGLSCQAQQEKETVVVIKTNYGTIKAKLYNDTPLHRDNFIDHAPVEHAGDEPRADALKAMRTRHAAREHRARRRFDRDDLAQERREGDG